MNFSSLVSRERLKQLLPSECFSLFEESANAVCHGFSDVWRGEFWNCGRKRKRDYLSLAVFVVLVLSFGSSREISGVPVFFRSCFLWKFSGEAGRSESEDESSLVCSSLGAWGFDTRKEVLESS